MLLIISFQYICSSQHGSRYLRILTSQNCPNLFYLFSSSFLSPGRGVGTGVGHPKPIEAPYMILFSVVPATLFVRGDLFFYKVSFQPEFEVYLCKCKYLIHKYFWFLWSFKCSEHQCDRMLGVWLLTIDIAMLF